MIAQGGFQDGRLVRAKKKKAANSLVQLYPLPQITPSTLVIVLTVWKQTNPQPIPNSWIQLIPSLAIGVQALLCQPDKASHSLADSHASHGNRVILRCMNLLLAVVTGLFASLALMVWVTPLLAITASVTLSVLHGPPGSEAASGR